MLNNLSKIVTKNSTLFGKRLYSSQSSLSSFPSFLKNTPETKITTLPNGIRIATEESFGETASVGVWVDSGSVYETDKNNGVAHFLEHMLFKGTSKRPNAQSIEVEVENMGANLNAFTSREHSAYYMKVLKDNVPNAVDILSDILQNSKFDAQNINSERGTILSEYEFVNSNPEEVIYDQLHAAAFQGSALGRTILGPVENIKSLTQEQIQSFIKDNYTGQRLVVVGSGAVNHEKLVEQVKERFQSIPAGSASTVKSIPNEFVGSELRVRDDSLPLVHLAVAVEGLPYGHPDFFTLEVIQSIIGNWNRNLASGKNISSRLGEIVATEGLAESFQTFISPYATTGLFGNMAVCRPETTDDLVCEMITEWQRIANSVTVSEIERAKKKLLATSLMHYDGNSKISEGIGRQILTLGRRITPYELYIRINDVTVEDVKRVAKLLLTDVSPAVTAIGPTSNLPEYNHVRGWTYWNRL